MTTYDNIFKIKHNNILPKQGSILISEPFLQNAYFQRSVVLLIDHNDEGSMGLVLNKKTKLIVSDFFPELKTYKEISIFLGGPVFPNRLFFIHSLGQKIIPESIQIDNSLYFDGDFKAIKRYILDGQAIEGKVKFFLGYSGWTKGQLVNEIIENSWLVSRPDHTTLLAAEGDELWKSSLESLGSGYETWANYPKDPYLN